MSQFKLFSISLMLTVSVSLAVIYVNRPKHPEFAAPELHQIANGLFVTSQLRAEGIRSLKIRGIQNIVDLRPDGEANDQASSSEIEAASKNRGLNFQYIPVPHENIPDGAVDALQAALSHQVAPTVLYCRSGRRAVRTFALVEASRADGPSAEAILEMARAAGFSADDLRDNIARRIAQRNNPQAAKN